MKLLRVSNLGVEIDSEKILEDLSFEVEEGETFIVLGPNGAGKTVLFKALLGLLPHTGEIVWKEGIKIGYVPQRLSMIKDFPLTVREFFGLKKYGKTRSAEALRLVGLTDSSIIEKNIGVLSSGQFQRALIAWGLVNHPQVLLMDEPMAGIDIEAEETIYALLEKLKVERGLTIFLVSHDLNIVYKHAVKVLCLNKKRLCYGLPGEVLTSENLTKIFGSEVSLYKHGH